MHTQASFFVWLIWRFVQVLYFSCLDKERGLLVAKNQNYGYLAKKVSAAESKELNTWTEAATA